LNHIRYFTINTSTASSVVLMINAVATITPASTAAMATLPRPI
jgi:hypothetical protein